MWRFCTDVFACDFWLPIFSCFAIFLQCDWVAWFDSCFHCDANNADVLRAADLRKTFSLGFPASFCCPHPRMVIDVAGGRLSVFNSALLPVFCSAFCMCLGSVHYFVLSQMAPVDTPLLNVVQMANKG